MERRIAAVYMRRRGCVVRGRSGGNVRLGALGGGDAVQVPLSGRRSGLRQRTEGGSEDLVRSAGSVERVWKTACVLETAP